MTSAQFHTVWLPLQGRFYRIAFYLLENDADAKDAVQDLYLKLWNLRDHLDLIREPQAYGAHMLRNLCIDRIRVRRPPAELLEDLSADVSKYVKSGRYELLMESKSDGEIMRMYTSGDNITVTSFVMLAHEGSEVSFICFDGRMDRAQMENLLAEAAAK